MKVRERIERRSEFKSEKFIILDPEMGMICANVNEFVGLRNDGKNGVRDDHPAMEFDVVKEEA